MYFISWVCRFAGNDAFGSLFACRSWGCWAISLLLIGDDDEQIYAGGMEGDYRTDGEEADCFFDAVSMSAGP